MTVTMTSEALGKQVGEDYTGPEEDWLLANGYAKRTGYTGPGVSNTGATGVSPDKDLLLASNREDHDDHDASASDINAQSKQPYNFDLGGVDNDPAVVAELDPAEGPAVGGNQVTIVGDGLENVSGVTFGGVAATDLDVVDDNEVTVTAPAHAAGPVDVVVTDSEGATTATAAYTYA